MPLIIYDPRAAKKLARETNGAFDITASGVGCNVARQVARAAEEAGGEAYRSGPGFRCEPVGTVGQLPSVVYECDRAAGGSLRFEAS